MNKRICYRCKKSRLQNLLMTLLFHLENVSIELESIKSWLISIQETVANIPSEEDR